MCEYCNTTGITRFHSRKYHQQVGCSICTDRWGFRDLMQKWESNGFPFNGIAFTCPVCGSEKATALYLEHGDDCVGCDKCIEEEVVPYDASEDFYPDCWRYEDYIIDRALDELKEARR